MDDVSKMMQRGVKPYKFNVLYKLTSISVCESSGVMAASLENYADRAAPGRLIFMDSNLKVLQLLMSNDCMLPEYVK